MKLVRKCIIILCLTQGTMAVLRLSEGDGTKCGVHSLLNRSRKLLVRHGKLSESYEALLHLAAAIMCRRTFAAIHG